MALTEPQDERDRCICRHYLYWHDGAEECKYPDCTCQRFKDEPEDFDDQDADE